MTVATIWVFCSCGTNDMLDVSERRSEYYTAADGTMAVTAVSGGRENPYQIDGKAGELKPYTLITLVPTSFNIDAVYTYTVRLGSATYGGALNVHPFAASFSAEGRAAPVSHLETVCRETSSASASSIWDRPCFFLKKTKVSFKSIANTSLFLQCC